jgi:hypothetical protein
MLHLFCLDVAEVDRGMLQMLQVFQRHVASVYSKCFICFKTCVAISRSPPHALLSPLGDMMLPNKLMQSPVTEVDDPFCCELRVYLMPRYIAQTLLG